MRKRRRSRREPLYRGASTHSISRFEIHALEGVAGLLRPDAVLLHGHFVDLDVLHLELAALLVHPEIDVVILVFATRLAKVCADKILPFVFQVPYRLVDLDELRWDGPAGLVVLNG